jgi:hypothetical protein
MSKAMVLGVLSLFLSGCVELGSSGWSEPRLQRQTSLAGAESGSRYALTLMSGDIQKIEQAAWSAVMTQAETRQISWSGAYGSANGNVTAGPNYLIGFNSGEEIEAPIDLDTSPYLTPSAGAYVTHSNSNIRLSPSLDGSKVTMLEKGAELTVIAREEQTNWLLVASQGRVIGYVFGELVTRIEGGDLLLAGGEPAQPKLCRELTYSMTLNTGDKDAWVNGACKQSGRDWHIVGGRALELAVY